jgi:hypothetical protein
VAPTVHFSRFSEKCALGAAFRETRVGIRKFWWQKPKRLDTIMPTILRVRGLRIAIYSNDHWPPHVHVIGADGHARVELGDECEEPSVMDSCGLSRSDLAVALAEIMCSRELLRHRWREIHGDA